MLTIADEGGRGGKPIADEGGGGVSKMLTIAEGGGGGVESEKKLIKWV